jgi:hypothetical protein
MHLQLLQQLHFTAACCGAVQYGYAYRKRTMIWSSLPLPASFVPKTCPGYPGCPCTYKNPETGKTGHIINMCADEVSQPWRGGAVQHPVCCIGIYQALCVPRVVHHVQQHVQRHNCTSM